MWFTGLEKGILRKISKLASSPGCEETLNMCPSYYWAMSCKWDARKYIFLQTLIKFQTFGASQEVTNWTQSGCEVASPVEDLPPQQTQIWKASRKWPHIFNCLSIPFFQRRKCIGGCAEGRIVSLALHPHPGFLSHDRGAQAQVLTFNWRVCRFFPCTNFLLSWDMYYSVNTADGGRYDNFGWILAEFIEYEPYKYLFWPGVQNWYFGTGTMKEVKDKEGAMRYHSMSHGEQCTQNVAVSYIKANRLPIPTRGRRNG